VPKPKLYLPGAGVELHAQAFELQHGPLHLLGENVGLWVGDLGLDCDCDADAGEDEGKPKKVWELMGVRDLVWLSVARGSSHDRGMMHVAWGYWQVRFQACRARANCGELCSEMEAKAIGVKCLF
jgi:hypothetical protein